MAENVTGSVVGKIRFNIDKKSWDNLDLFQKKMTSVKKQMSTMDKSIKVQAVITNVNKIANAQIAAEKKVVESSRRLQQGSTRKKSTDISDRLSWLFPAASLANPANKTQFAQMMIAEEKAAMQLQREYDIRRRDVMGRRNKKLAYRAKRDAKSNSNRTAFEQSVINHMDIKRSQMTQYMDRVGMGVDQRKQMFRRLEESKTSALSMIDPTAPKAIETFRKQLNISKNEMLNNDRIVRANAISYKSLRGEIVALTAAYGAYSVVANIAQTGMNFEGLRASAKVFAKDEAGVAEHMSFIRNEAMRLGVDLQTATKEFTKFSIATKMSLTKDEQRSLFTGVSEYATVLGASKEDYQRAFRALQQIECCLPV